MKEQYEVTKAALTGGIKIGVKREGQAAAYVEQKRGGGTIEVQTSPGFSAWYDSEGKLWKAGLKIAEYVNNLGTRRRVLLPEVLEVGRVMAKLGMESLILADLKRDLLEMIYYGAREADKYRGDSLSKLNGSQLNMKVRSPQNKLLNYGLAVYQQNEAFVVCVGNGVRTVSEVVLMKLDPALLRGEINEETVGQMLLTD